MSKNNGTQRVVRLSTLSEFLAEVLTSQPLRLILTQKRRDGRLPISEVALSLQGINDLGEIVWIWQSRLVNMSTGKPLNGVSEEGCAMEKAYDLVKHFLTQKGYTIRGGSYGLPGIEPINGHFDILKWEKKEGENGISVSLREQEEQPEIEIFTEDGTTWSFDATPPAI